MFPFISIQLENQVLPKIVAREQNSWRLGAINWTNFSLNDYGENVNREETLKENVIDKWLVLCAI